MFKALNAGAVGVGLAVLVLAGCGGTAGEGAGHTQDMSASASETRPSDTVAEAIQNQMLVAIEKTYARRNARTRIEGSVVHVAMEGDASGNLAGWSDCRVLSQLVREGETVVLEFPKGTIDCAELLSQGS